MRKITATKNPLIVRTDFSNDKTWKAICKKVAAKTDGFVANVEYVDDHALDGFNKKQVLACITKKHEHPFIVIVDDVSMSNATHALLVVDLEEKRGREFRAVPKTIQSIENNLSIANMEFSEFAERVGRDKIFRGF